MKYHIEQSIDIRADIASVTSLIKDFSMWNSWSPWIVLEPDCAVGVEGAPGEAGHSMRWDGDIIGSGTNILLERNEDTLKFDLQFEKPFKSRADVQFLLTKNGDTTKVTWTMDSSMPFFMFFMVDIIKGLVSMDYERGLKMLKAIAEKGTVDATTKNNGIIDYAGFSYIGIQKTLPIADIGTEMKKDFGTIITDVIHERGKDAKHWIALYPKMDMKNMRMTYIAAISDEELQDEDMGEQYVRGTISDGRVLEIKHVGPYDFLGNAWSMGMIYLRAKKLKQRPIPFEEYWNSPLEVPPTQLKTSIFFPLK